MFGSVLSREPLRLSRGEVVVGVIGVRAQAACAATLDSIASASAGETHVIVLDEHGILELEALPLGMTGGHDVIVAERGVPTVADLAGLCGGADIVVVTAGVSV